MNISALWDTLVDAICRPPRDKYQVSELVGGRRGYCKLAGRTIVREDIVLVNKKGLKLQCSHYKPSGATPEHALPIVIYCHCNSGSRRDAEEAFYVLLPHNITVFCLDFAGSGVSDGDWVTLGAHEVDDLEVAVAHLRENYPHSTIGLWGRSMGAVTALIYGSRDPSIAGVVMDSPFARLTELMVELVDEQRLPIPKPFMRVALGMMRRSVRKRAGFNIDSVAPLDIVPQCFIPALFGHATEDTFVNKSHSQRLHDAYVGADKSFVTFKGDHNSVRPQSFYSSVLMFMHTALRCSDSLATLSLTSTPTKLPSTSTEVSLKSNGTDKELSRGNTMIRADSSTKEECISPRQRELPPPWNRELARTNTEQHLEFMRGLARTQSGLSATSREDRTAGDGISRCTSEDAPTSISSHWLEAEPPLDPPQSIERAPWLDVDPAAAPSRLSGEKAAQPLSEGPKAPAATGTVSSLWPPSANARRECELRAHSLDGMHGSAASSPVQSASAGPPETPAATPEHVRGPSCMGVEDRFWHLTEGTDSSLLSSEDDESLARALEESLLEAGRQAQRHSGVATMHAGRETRLDALIPDSMRHISQEDAEELMLVEAMKASLLEAEQNGLVDPSPQPSCELGQNIADTGSGRKSGKPKSRGLFWRKKDAGSSRITSPAK